MHFACRLILCGIILTGFLAMPAAAADEKTAGTYSNPVIDVMGMADPSVIRVDGAYYLYPTWDGNSDGFDVFTSPDLVHWEHRGTAFSAPEGGAWAPDVFYNKRGDGKFYLYYTENGPSPQKRIGVAVADSPLGPFEDKGWLFDYDAIDAHLFQDDDGALYLYYVDRRAIRISVQRMSDPLHKKGNPKSAVYPTEPWERLVTEGPWMVKRDDTYYLMYSGNFFNYPDYAIGYATAKSPGGPFTKYSGNPIASRGDGVFGPGHHCVVEGPHGDLWMVYHQKEKEEVSYIRFIAIDPLWFDDDGVIHTRTTRGTEQKAP